MVCRNMRVELRIGGGPLRTAPAFVRVLAAKSRLQLNLPRVSSLSDFCCTQSGLAVFAGVRDGVLHPPGCIALC